ncbi:MAG: hypothetical protein OXR73_20785 [Myxococcales bacterium]|nr:hypothetical protein [Myxococcales bacterium]
MRHAIVLVALVLCACGSSDGANDGTTEAAAPGSAPAQMGNPPLPAMTASRAGATAQAPSVTDQPSPAEPPGQAAAASDPGQGQPPTVQPAAAGAGGPGLAEPVEPASGAMGNEAAELPPPTDNCVDRRVSYSQPCHSDPNPCGIDSGFPGDEFCILPPAEGEGFQIHIGPDDYADPAEIAKYTIEPGEEFNNSVLGHIPVDEDVFFNRITVQLRPGSHHWISSVVEGRPEERVYNGTDCEGARQIGSVGGGQNLIYDNPPGGVPAPENEGLGRELRGDSSLCMNLHAYNVTEQTQLREMWINVYTAPEAEVTQRAGRIGIVGGLGMAVPPGEKETITYTETFDRPGRIIQLYGHRHAWTPRFAVWLNDELIYDSWDWYESIVYNYDSLTMNPPINSDAKVDGAISGMLEVKAGDQLKFSCFVENDSDITMRWANSLYGGEMCNLWGTTVGTQLVGSRW